ncbi:MAG: Mur ligase family protein, partial [Polyangiaceae bacterium]
MRHVDTLLSRSGRGAKFGLERMMTAREALGHPDRMLPIVHVAGTNGKGSVCAMVESIATSAGLKTGLYTSPHLSRLNERIRIGGEPITDERLEEVLAEVLHGNFPPLTFFEAMTLAAFLAMNRAEVELAVIEVGLGGRLDATNVIETPRVTAISNVALDHVNVLGDRVGLIAKEKAGIFKANVPVVLGPLDAEARGPVLAHARAVGAGPIHEPKLDPRLASAIGLVGDHQRDNAAVAVGIVHAMDDERLLPHLKNGLKTTRWPGRHETIPYRQRLVLFDCAHNESAARALAQTLRSSNTRDAILVFGALEDKDWQRMLAQLLPFTRQRLYCAPPVLMAGRKEVPYEA